MIIQFDLEMSTLVEQLTAETSWETEAQFLAELIKAYNDTRHMVYIKGEGWVRVKCSCGHCFETRERPDGYVARYCRLEEIQVNWDATSCCLTAGDQVRWLYRGAKKGHYAVFEQLHGKDSEVPLDSEHGTEPPHSA